MAVAVNTVSEGSAGSAASLSFAATAGGSDDAIVVLIAGNQGSGMSVSSVQFAGQSLSFGGGVTAGDVRAELYYLLNPATNSGNVSITLAWSIDELQAIAVSFTGVGSIGSVGTNGGPSEASSQVSVSSVVSGLVIDAVAYDQNASLTLGAGQSLAGDVLGTNLYLASSQEAGASLVSMDWGFSFSVAVGQVAVALAPTGGGGGSARRMMLMGAG